MFYLYLNVLKYAALSDYDRACLVAKYNSLYKRETIDPKIFENRTEAEIKYLRKSLGNVSQISCGLEFSKDFKEYPDFEHFNFSMLAAHVFEKSGTLTFPGSVSEQPAQFMEIIETIMELNAEREQDAYQKAKQEKNGHR